VSIARVVKVATAIITLSSIVGAIAGAVCAVLLGAIYSGPMAALGDTELIGIGASIGGLSGLLLGPLASFGFMRRVPLGRLFAETGVATVIAGTLGLLLPVGFPAALSIAAAGFLGASANLARRYRRPKQVNSLPAAS
jgi:hypothetical protein